VKKLAQEIVRKEDTGDAVTGTSLCSRLSLSGAPVVLAFPGP
jgi:hypothetical protein